MSVRGAARHAIGAALARRTRLPSPGRILLYHAVAGAADGGIPLALFAEQLTWLANAGLTCSSVRDALAWPDPRNVALSFDDGLGSAAGAVELIGAHGWSATVFVVPGWIDAGRRDVLSWEELRELARAGVEIGAHGWAHERPCGRGVAEVTRLFARARARIEERVGVPVRGLAYPEGLAPRHARDAARRAGYVYACTTQPGANDASDPFRLRRNEVLATDDTGARLLGKLGGSDDWMRPVRAIENALRCR